MAKILAKRTRGAPSHTRTSPEGSWPGGARLCALSCGPCEPPSGPTPCWAWRGPAVRTPPAWTGPLFATLRGIVSFFGPSHRQRQTRAISRHYHISLDGSARARMRESSKIAAHIQELTNQLPCRLSCHPWFSSPETIPRGRAETPRRLPLSPCPAWCLELAARRRAEAAHPLPHVERPPRLVGGRDSRRTPASTVRLSELVPAPCADHEWWCLVILLQPLLGHLPGWGTSVSFGFRSRPSSKSVWHVFV